MQPEDIAFGRSDLSRQGTVSVRWLGTAGFAISCENHVVLFDPYVTRASLSRCLVARLVSDPLVVRSTIPRADAIVVGHTHFDHALDVPTIAALTGARVFGSRSAVRLCRASGIAEDKLTDVEGAHARGPIEAHIGPFHLLFHPSAHSRFMLGRVPFPGDIRDCEDIPMRAEDYRCGAVFAVEVRVAGKTIVHLGSAELVDTTAPKLSADLVLLCVAGWTTSDKLPTRVMRAFSPGAVLLSHWDNFLRPLSEPAVALPAMAMPRLVDALQHEAPDVRVGTLPLLAEILL